MLARILYSMVVHSPRLQCIALIILASKLHSGNGTLHALPSSSSSILYMHNRPLCVRYGIDDDGPLGFDPVAKFRYNCKPSCHLRHQAARRGAGRIALHHRFTTFGSRGSALTSRYSL